MQNCIRTDLKFLPCSYLFQFLFLQISGVQPYLLLVSQIILFFQFDVPISHFNNELDILLKSLREYGQITKLFFDNFNF